MFVTCIAIFSHIPVDVWQLLLSWWYRVLQGLFESGTFSKSCGHNWSGAVDPSWLKVSRAANLDWRNKWCMAFRNSKCVRQICIRLSV